MAAMESSSEAGSSPNDREELEVNSSDTSPTPPIMTNLTLTAAQAQSQANELEKLSMWVMEASNDKTQIELISRYLDKSLFSNKSDHELEPANRSPSTQIANQKAYLAQNPDRQVHALNASCLISENMMQAEVFVTTVVRGYYAQFTRESVTQFKWRRRNGLWKIVEYNMLRGCGGEALQVETPAFVSLTGPARPP